MVTCVGFKFQTHSPSLASFRTCRLPRRRSATADFTPSRGGAQQSIPSEENSSRALFVAFGSFAFAATRRTFPPRTCCAPAPLIPDLTPFFSSIAFHSHFSLHTSQFPCLLRPPRTASPPVVPPQEVVVVKVVQASTARSRTSASLSKCHPPPPPRHPRRIPYDVV